MKTETFALKILIREGLKVTACSNIQLPLSLDSFFNLNKV